MKSLRLIILRETWSHMATVSGYDPLAAALHACVAGQAVDVVVRPTAHAAQRRIMRLGSRLAPWLIRRPDDDVFASAAGLWDSVAAAQKATALLSRHPEARMVMMVGENQVHTGFRNLAGSDRKRIFVVLHQPPSWLRIHWNDFRLLDGLGGVICLSEHQADFIASVCDSPVIRSRHGVSTEFFQPTPDAGAVACGTRLLFVGAWLRDFRTLGQAMTEVWREFPDAHLDCVVPRRFRNFYELLPLARDVRVHWHTDLSAEALRSLYRQATLLFMPLLDATANNGLLEGMACGLPVVSTDVGGTPDYICDEAGRLCAAGDAADHAAAVIASLRNPQWRKEAALAAPLHATKHFRWEAIAADLCKHFLPMDAQRPQGPATPITVGRGET